MLWEELALPVTASFQETIDFLLEREPIDVAVFILWSRLGELIPDVIHVTDRYANNRAEQSHEATRVRERGMRKFKLVRQAQRFLGAHATVSNLFNLGRHKVGAQHYRDLRVSALTEWSRAVA